MSRRRIEDATAWRNTAAGVQSWREAFSDAQAKANATGFDYGIEANDVFKSFNVFLLPCCENRYGVELRCEVVSCLHLDRCQPGHGP